MILGIAQGIKRNKVVGHNATAAIHRAPHRASLKLQRVGEVYAIGMHQFAFVKALLQVFAIVYILAIGLLYTAA